MNRLSWSHKGTMNDTINDFCTNVDNALGKKYSRERADSIKARFAAEDIVSVRQIVKVINAGVISKDEITAMFRAGYSALVAVRCTEALYHLVDHPTLTAHKALMATDEGHSSKEKNVEKKKEIEKVKTEMKEKEVAKVTTSEGEKEGKGKPWVPNTTTSGTSKKKKFPKICFDFVKGHCRQGDKCDFNHPCPPDMSNITSGEASSEDSCSITSSRGELDESEPGFTSGGAGVKNGFGRWKGDAGESYEGHFFDNLRHGFGKYVSAEHKEVYEGTWERGLRQGTGKQQRPKFGTVYSGTFVRNQREGEGELKFPDGTSFTGIFKKDVPYAGKLHRCDGSTDILQAGDDFSLLYKGPEAKSPAAAGGVKMEKTGVCYDFVNKGACRRGKDCKFRHNSQWNTVNARAGADSGADSAVAPSTHSGPSVYDSPFTAVTSSMYPSDNPPGLSAAKKKKGKSCFDFLKGHCRRGEACIFQHVSTSTTSMIVPGNAIGGNASYGPSVGKLPPPIQLKNMCYEFAKKGSCAFGAECKFSHNSPLSGQRTAQREPLHQSDLGQRDPQQGWRSLHLQGGQEPKTIGLTFNGSLGCDGLGGSSGIGMEPFNGVGGPSVFAEGGFASVDMDSARELEAGSLVFESLVGDILGGLG